MPRAYARIKRSEYPHPPLPPPPLVDCDRFMAVNLAIYQNAWTI